MSINFSRTTRSIQANNLVIVTLYLISFIIIAILCVLWFFFAQIPLYKTSTQANFTTEGVIEAQFEEEALSVIQAGRSATFQTTISGNKITISAIVIETNAATGKVRLTPQSQVDIEPFFSKDVSGQVFIEVDRLTPAKLLFTAAGLNTSS